MTDHQGPRGARRHLRACLAPDENVVFETGAASIGAVPRKGLIAITSHRVLFIAGFGGLVPSAVWAIAVSDTWAEQRKDRFYWLLTVHSDDERVEQVRVFSEPAAVRIVSALPPPATRQR